MILVTGGAGYIGSHCVLALLKNNYDVVIFDNLSTGHQETADKLAEFGNVKFHKGDLTSTEDLNNLFSKLNLLDAMLAHDVRKIVFSSTAATYGEPVYTPIDEKHPQNPINTYGRTKLMIENIMDDYDRAYSLKSVRLRYFNVAGADSENRVGEWHDPETHLIPNILKSVFSGGKTFQMFGTDYETRDGTCVRDYINVEDLANAHILALQYLMNGGNTNFFNLGTNEGNTVKEVFRACEKITEKTIPVDVKPRRAGDPASLVADNNKAKTVLGWNPDKNLDDSINTAYRWEQKLQDFLAEKKK